MDRILRKAILITIAALLPFMTFAQQWVPCNEPLGGSPNTLASFDNNIWVGTDGGGVYRSADDGQTWMADNDGLINNSFQRNIRCLHPMGNKILAGTSTGMFYKNTTGGPWQPTSLSIDQVISIADHNGFVIAGFYASMAKSTDGITWTALPGTGLPNNYAVQHIVSTQGTVIINTAQSGNEMYKSTDDGMTWTVLARPTNVPANSYADYMGMVGDRLFISYYYNGLFYSDDAGQTWNNSLGNGTTGDIPGDVRICNGQYVYGSGVLHTRPVVGGTNWTSFNTGLEEINPLLTHTLKHNGYLFVATGFEGMYRIDTMLTNFEKINTGLVATEVQFIDGNGPRVIAQAYRQVKLRSSIDNGVTWTADPIGNDNTSGVTSSTINGNKWYMGLLNGVRLSTDGGATWNLIATGMTNLSVQSLLTTSTGDVYAGTNGGKIYKNVDDTAWVEIPTTLTNQSNVFELLEVGPHIFLGTQSAFGGVAHLYRTDNTFQNLQVVSSSWNATFENVCGLAYQGDRLIAGSSGYGTFFSTDFGATWDTLNAGLPPNNVFRDMKIFNGRIYAARDVEDGLYYLDSAATEWQCYSCNPGDPRAISVYIADTTVYVGTRDNGVWKTHVPDTTVLDVDKMPTAKMNNLLAYPNPGSAPYIQLSKSDVSLPATISVYDAVGKLCYKEVITTYSYQLKQPQLTSGNYVISITDSDNKQATVKWIKD